MPNAPESEYKHWYDLRVWTRLKQQFFITYPDQAICNHVDPQTGKRCDRPSTDVDHIIPHKGNWDLFTDLKNLQGLCHAHHAEKTAAENGGFGNKPKEPAPGHTTNFGGVGGCVSAVGSDAINKALGDWA